MKKLRERFAEDISDKEFVYFGWSTEWPKYLLPTGYKRHLQSRGARVADGITDKTNFVVIGAGREKGKAEAPRKAEKLKAKGQEIAVLDPHELFRLLRPDIADMTFAFTGGFSHGAADLEGGPAALLEPFGAHVAEEITNEVDFLVVGERRAKGKTSDLRKAQDLMDAGVNLQLMEEQGFLDLLASQKTTDDSLDFSGFVVQLRGVADPRRINRAIKMLKKESYDLYAQISDECVSGIVRSQTRDGDYYAPWLGADGTYGCCDDYVEPCMGLQGSVCKHLLVLLMGLANSGELEPKMALDWMKKASTRRPGNNHDPSAEALLRYKGVQAGEVDWRPTETIPEDYYMF